MPANRATIRAVAAALFVAVTAVLFVVSDPAQAAGVLFVLPVALLAITDGRAGGLGAAGLATALVAAWVIIDDIDLDGLGWLSRVTSFVATGLLVGHYVELAGRLERRRVGERYALELQDHVLQELVMARYALADEDAARPHVDEALERVKAIISERVGDVGPGDLRLEGEPPPPGGGDGAPAR